MRLFWKMRLFAVAAFAGALHSLPARAEEAGLPQLDTSLFPEQLFWLAVSFALLYVLMAVVALPGVEKTQDNRKALLTSEIEAARLANEAASATVEQVTKSLNTAHARAQADIAEMLATAKHEALKQQTAQEKELTRQLRRAEEEIAVTRAAALKSVQSEAFDLASTIVEKIIGSKIQVSL